MDIVSAQKQIDIQRDSFEANGGDAIMNENHRFSADFAFA